MPTLDPLGLCNLGHFQESKRSFNSITKAKPFIFRCFRNVQRFRGGPQCARKESGRMAFIKYPRT